MHICIPILNQPKQFDPKNWGQNLPVGLQIKNKKEHLALYMVQSLTCGRDSSQRGWGGRQLRRSKDLEGQREAAYLNKLVTFDVSSRFQKKVG